MLTDILAAVVLLQDGTAQPSPTDAADALLADVVVTGSRDAPPFDPFAPFAAICFDGNRLARVAAAPGSDDPVWVVLDQEERVRLRVGDGIRAYRQDRARLSLLLRIDERSTDGLTENRCQISLVGDHDPRDLIEGMQRLFSSPGTREHVGRVRGYEDIPGWEQWAWTAMPDRKTSRWRGFEPREGVAYVVVARPFFYRRYAWVIGDLRFIEEGARPISQLTLTLRFRP